MSRLLRTKLITIVLFLMFLTLITSIMTATWKIGITGIVIGILLMILFQKLYEINRQNYHVSKKRKHKPKALMDKIPLGYNYCDGEKKVDDFLHEDDLLDFFPDDTDSKETIRNS